MTKQDERPSIKPVTPMRRGTQPKTKLQLIRNRVVVAVEVVQLIGPRGAADITRTLLWGRSQLAQNRAAHTAPLITQI